MHRSEPQLYQIEQLLDGTDGCSLHVPCMSLYFFIFQSKNKKNCLASKQIAFSSGELKKLKALPSVTYVSSLFC